MSNPVSASDPRAISRRHWLGAGALALGPGLASAPSEPQAFEHPIKELKKAERLKLAPLGYPLTRKDFSPRRVIVLIIDSLRADHVGALSGGTSPARTPNLDAFAADSVVFPNAYTEGLPSVPARTALYTGKFTYPFRGWQVLWPEDEVLAELLWREQFTTCYVCDHLALHAPKYAFERGFDEVHWIRGQYTDPYIRDPRMAVDIEPHYFPRRGDPAERVELTQFLRNATTWKNDDDQRPTAKLFSRAVDWLARHRDDPNLFLWMECFSPHPPNDPPAAYRAMYGISEAGKRNICPFSADLTGYLDAESLRNWTLHYAADCTYVDDWFGFLIGELKRLGMYDDSLIIVGTDHGEAFGEHGVIRKDARPLNYEEVARTFYMVRMPGGAGSGRRIETPVQNVDITLTIMDHLTVHHGPDPMTGASLMPLIRGEKETLRGFAVSCWHKGAWALYMNGWKYIYYQPESRRPNARTARTLPMYELFNLKQDPGERHDLSGKEPQLLRDMDQHLRAYTDWLKSVTQVD